MKKIILAAFVTVFSLSLFAADPGVDQKVLDAFSKTFKQAQNVSWSSSGNTYEVRFRQNEITSKVTYNKDGDIVRTLRYFSEEHLPIMVVSRIKAKYASKKIYGVVEEASEEGTFYHITLEGEKDWIELRSDVLGSTTVERKFRKA